MATLKINTGKITLDIERDREPTGKISFNPENTDFRAAVVALMNGVEEKEKEFTDKAKAIEASAVDEIEKAKSVITLEKEVGDYLSEEIDKVFGSGTSATAFGESCTIEAVMSFFDGITPFVRKASEKKMSKYVK